MKKSLNYLFCFVAMTLVAACSDFIEIDLSNQTITVYSPANNSTSSNFTQHFKWEPLEGASSYQLQIVKPDFTSIQEFILDTTTLETELNYTLQPGIYQWRIRAKNNSSHSEFQVYTITVDSTLNLSGQSISLISPADNSYSNIAATTFSWQPMNNADFYVFQLLSSGAVIETQSPTTTSISYTFTTEGSYQWRVFAQNAYSSSSYSSRTFTFDQTPPAAPTLTHPLANDTASNPVLLSWIDDVNVISDSLYIYTDTALTSIVYQGVNSTQNYSFTGTASQDYFWRVKSKDAAGNWGAFSLQRKFIVNP